jgi:hypothetical protein
MRWAALIVFLAIATAVLWSLRPQRAGACSCAQPALQTVLEPIDGSTASASLCLTTYSFSQGTSTVLAPCEGPYIFDDELFWRQQ